VIQAAKYRFEVKITPQSSASSNFGNHNSILF